MVYYAQFKRVNMMILVLSYGQTFVERGFNINKNMLQPNLEGLPLTSQRLSYDHYRSLFQRSLVKSEKPMHYQEI